ncbi:alkane 1-monooxygenase [uncultured Roseobacter sp.]|uniref:alkane 1-monooxygenase n=1 Tax=uncultured Roseobacter sp. TaxID=114847 RepID=UPI002612BD96|nr:alkane 1-monooxygenase [uncultured Roseobacter sp.]
MIGIRPSTLAFASASLAPALLLAVGAFAGGVWAYAGPAAMTALVMLMDGSRIACDPDPTARHWLPRLLGWGHFVLLGTGVWAIGAGDHLDPGQKLALGIGLGLYVGQVSNACAHELIHRPDRPSRRLGAAIYCSLMNGQHVSAHLLVHHVHAGTARDPNSAPLGRGFWRFFATVLRDEFVAGWRVERARRADQPLWQHPYVAYLAGSALTLICAGVLGGIIGIVTLLLLALHAHLQLMLSDYVQHYGLRRRVDAAGKPEPIGPQHSWNAPQRFSAAVMLNAPLHSDHHMNPGRSFDTLRHDPGLMPTLPGSVPLMAALALAPPLWRHVMDPRVRKIQAQTPAADGKQPPAPVPPSGRTAVLLSE